MRYLWIGLGFLNVALGIIGAFLPVMPTTVFLIIAAFSFAKGSPRLHAWLMNHPRFGPPLQDWEKHGAISRKAKRLAVSMMAASFVISALVGLSPVVLLIEFAVLACVAIFILTRPDGA
jgi:uncharacterized protein